MIKKLIDIISFFLLVGITSCIDKYDFSIQNDNPGIVIESFISDKSYADIRGLPDHEGRFFYVKVSQTGDVNSYSSNANKIDNATVYIETSNGELYYYVPQENGEGLYILFDTEFKAEEGIEYRLVVDSEFGRVMSDWEILDPSDNTMGDICFSENSIFRTEYQGDEKVFVNQKVADFYIDLPPKAETTPHFYFWAFNSTWVYKAPLNQDPNVENCWIYEGVSDFTIWRDYIGGYNHKLFHIETIDNGKINHSFSMSISQYLVSENYYLFLQELREQDQRGGLYDPPPYNVRSNFQSMDENISVIGYFEVAKEEVSRLYFSDDDLSYHVPDYRKYTCENGRPPKPQDCYDCTKYKEANSQSNIPPAWWPIVSYPATPNCE